jgi:hypothetical protein
MTKEQAIDKITAILTAVGANDQPEMVGDIFSNVLMQYGSMACGEAASASERYERVLWRETATVWDELAEDLEDVDWAAASQRFAELEDCE